jgi:TATA-box binding protein (TBP) (component of TFIID and TFIIIB)
LRWCDQEGKVIPTGAERAETEHQRAELLAQKLRELGIDPDRL